MLEIWRSVFIFIQHISKNHPHQLCSRQMEETQVGLQVSLLVRSQETGELFVNFDPQILTQIREVKCMTRMNLEIPHFATVLQQKHDSLKQNYNKLQVGIYYTNTF